MAYSEQVLDHYENPRNVGKMDETDAHVGTGMVGAPACGDVMRLQIKVNDAGAGSYPHPTTPTDDSVYSSVVSVSLYKKPSHIIRDNISG